VHAWFTKAEYSATDLLDAVDRLSQPAAPAEFTNRPTAPRWQDSRFLNN
jgi:hypothetical protein